MSPIDPLTLSVVTPSYRQAEWLRLCAASVADQEAPGLTVEHIVQDALSGPAVAEAVSRFPQLQLVSEKDGGMYDAINRGWAKATGDILCWLNCDEQFLPGALATVTDYFRAHPEVDILFGDAIVVDAQGNYLCSRQVLEPLLVHTWICHLHTFSCATFFRRSLIKERGFTFDTRWRVVGDAALMIALLRTGARVGTMRRYLSVFVDTGENLGQSTLAQQERLKLISEAPRWMQALQPVWRLHHRLRRLAHGLYWPKPFTFDLYTPVSPQRRIHLEVTRPTFYWASQMK